MKFKAELTNRGFKFFTFNDLNGRVCTLQHSSLATEDAIWLGIDDPKPKILASKAKEYSIKTDETTGWIDYNIPDDVLINTRMHLTTTQAKELVKVLENFIKEIEEN